MDASHLELWRGSMRALSMALGFPSGHGTPETDFYHRLMAGERRIGTVGLKLQAHVVASIWRTMFKPVGMTIVVTETEAQGQWFVDLCEKFVTRNEIVRNRVWIGREKVGLCASGSNVMHMVHVRPNDIYRLDPVGDCLILIPNLDSIPGAYLKLASELVLVPGVSLSANTPKH